ncbi:MAG: tetratricopeptide repeat protein [Cytophagales bacterium]|nr:MAG: tetratricopeptide repeat protein [Cytophagales bacterium]
MYPLIGMRRANPISFCLLLSWLLVGSVGYAQSVQDQLEQANKEQDPSKAVALYEAIIEKNPRLVDAYYGRAVMLTRLRQFTEALRDVNAALKLNSKHDTALAQRAYIHVQLDDYDRAAEDYQRAIKLDPQKAEYYSGLSYCLTKHNRLAEAERVAQKGIDLNRSSPYAYRNRGRARLYQGQADAAIADFETGMRLQHREPYRLYSDLGEAYEQKKMPEKALACYRQALSLNPDYVDAQVRQTILEQQLKVGSALPASTFAGRRVALVLGNSAYRSSAVGGLGGQPLNDAHAMQQRLSELGFDTQISTDATYAVMKKALDQFYQRAKGADVALLFYAGHGIEHAQTNYLLPTDVNLDPAQADSLNRRAISVTTIIDQLQDQQPRYCVIIMDACRDDPYATQPARSTVSVATAQQVQMPVVGARGFRAIRVESRIRNCCIALATAPGATARNGPNKNGYYTEALLRFMRRGQRLDDVFGDVRGEVMTQTRKTGFVQLPEFINRAIERMIL